LSSWPIASLGDVVQINPRVGTERASADLPVSFVPMAAVCEHTGSIVSSDIRPFGQVSKGFPIFAENDVLFAKITPCMENGKAAIARNLENGTGAGSTEFFVLRPTSRILSEYVFHFIRRTSFRATCKANFTGSAGQQRVPKSFLEKVAIPLPPLNEQRRIVGLLDRAAEIRRRADAARAKARAIIPALFLDTFGDPATNPKGWPVQSLNEIADIGSGLTKGRKFNGTPTEPTPYLRVANVQADRLDLTEIKMIDATDDDRVRCRLLPGDLLMTEGGDLDKLGRCAMWRGEIDLCLHQNHIFRVRMGFSVIPDYSRAFMQSEAARGYFLRVAKRTTGIASINKTQLGQLPVWVPPLHLQTAFAEQASRLDSLARHLDAAAAKAEAMAAGLSAEVFGASSSRGNGHPA
jgi:type I restriction enzyme S subunit